MKFGTNIHHMSGHCRKGFQGQMSKVRVVLGQLKLMCIAEAYIASVWRRGWVLCYIVLYFDDDMHADQLLYLLW